MWSAAVLEPALPGRSSMARHSPVFAHHAARGGERFLEGAGGAFLLGGGGDDRGVHVDHDPAVQPLSGDGQPGKAAGPQFQQRPHMSADRARTCASFFATVASIAARVRRVVESDTAGPKSPWRWA